MTTPDPEARSTGDRWCIAIIALALLVPLWGLLRSPGPPMEEGFMLTFPEQILRGSFPHRDFLHLYGPGSLYLLAAFYKVLGSHLEVERLVGLGQHAVVAFALFALLRPWGRRIATIGSLVSVIVLMGATGLTALAWNGSLALGLSAMAVGALAVRRTRDENAVGVDRVAGRLAVLAGCLGALALLWRPDAVLAVGLGLGATAVALDRSRRLRLLMGAAAGLVLYIPHLLVSGIGDSFEGMFVEPVLELRGGRSLPVPPSWGSIDGFLQRVGAIDANWPLPALGTSQQIFVWFCLVVVSIIVVVGAGWSLHRSMPGSDRAISYWPVALFSAALLPQALQRPDTAHLAWVSGVSFPLSIAAVTYLIERWRPSWPPSRAQWSGVASVAVVIVVLIPTFPLRSYIDASGQTFGIGRSSYPIERDGRRFYYGNEQVAADGQRIVDVLDERSRPGERLIVGPADLSRTVYDDSFLYHLFPELVPGTRYIEMDPGIADAPDSDLAGELERADWLILSDLWSGWDEPNASTDHGSDAANQVVADRYCTEAEAGRLTLMRRCR